MRRSLSLFVCLLMMFGCLAGTTMALDPLDDADADADPDRDNLSNAEEFFYATDPNDPDSDMGGCYDGWEVWYDNHRAVRPDGRPIISDDYHFDPNYGSDEGTVENPNPNMLYQVKDRDANAWLNDPDNDGWNNLHEFLAGTDPTNPNTDSDMYPDDSTDPDPLVAENIIPEDWEDDHPGNGGGGSGEGEGLASLMA